MQTGQYTQCFREYRRGLHDLTVGEIVIGWLELEVLIVLYSWSYSLLANEHVFEI